MSKESEPAPVTFGEPVSNMPFYGASAKKDVRYPSWTLRGTLARPANADGLSDLVHSVSEEHLYPHGYVRVTTLPPGADEATGFDLEFVHEHPFGTIDDGKYARDVLAVAATGIANSLAEHGRL